MQKQYAKYFSHTCVHGKDFKCVLSDMKRPVFYAETSIITQKQTLFTHLTWKRPQIHILKNMKNQCFMQKHQSWSKNKLFSHILHGKGRKYVLSDMKRPVFYAETSIITQKQTFFTHFAWKMPQICTFWHEKTGVLCRNINHYTKTNFIHTFNMEKAANMYFLTWKGQYLMQKHQ